jgi:hypothetical protein
LEKQHPPQIVADQLQNRDEPNRGEAAMTPNFSKRRAY